jgi:hypothetical protein
MSGIRTVFLGLFMALVSSAIVLGSLSLSLLEGGRGLVQAPTLAGEMVFESEPILTLGGSGVTTEEITSNTQAEAPTILTPTPGGCPHPANWIAIVIRPEDTLKSLAHRYDTSVYLLKTNNCLPTDTLVMNSTLYVPNVPPRPTPTRPRPTYPWTYPTAYPTVSYWPTATPWFPTSTPVTPPTLPPTTPPTLPPPPPPTATPLPPPTEQPPTATPLPPPTEPPPTQPPPTQPPPTEPPPTEPPPPTATVEIYPFP